MGVLKIEKKTFPEIAVLLLVFLPFTYSFLVELIGIPNVIKFISDFLLLASLVIVALKSFSHGKLFIPKTTLPFVIIVLAFLVYAIVGYLLNYQSIFYLIWGIRNNFRFYFAFFIFVFFFQKDSAKFCLKLIEWSFWINFAVILIQFFMGYQQDYLGGIFGVQKGCNGYTMALLCIVVAKSLLMFMNGQEKALKCFSICAVSLLVSALSELKLFFVLFVLILLVATILTRFSIKKCISVLVSFTLLFAAYLILISLFENFEGFFSWESLANALLSENYGSSEDLGRFTAIPMISSNFLPDFSDKLIGMGIGNCDTSSLAIFNTEFYKLYSHIHYSIFLAPFMFIEMGFIGLTFFVSFFVVCLVKTIVAIRKKQGDVLFNQMALIMVIICFIFMFYNAILRTEAGYIIYFILALPFIGLKEDAKEEVKEEVKEDTYNSGS